jgi:hypothetical protein
MRYFRLKDDAFRGDCASNTYFQTNDDLTDQQIIVVSVRTQKKWSVMRYDDEKLDISDCFEITKKEYDREFDAHIERNTW